MTRETSPESNSYKQAQGFPTERLIELLGDRLGARLEDVRQMRGGKSNPTFLLVTDRGGLVLRKQPPGKLLPSAHAVDREYRVISALANTPVPVPRALLFCEDPSVIGTPFYLMEHLRGRIFWRPTLVEIPREDRRGIYFGMVDALARLHMVDWRAVGLADFGKPGNYFSRQITRWMRQWQNSRTRDNPCVEKLAAWLPANIPPGDDTTIAHGDFRLDNMIFHPTEPRVLGIIDWELSTLGHPLADLGYNCIPYVVRQPEYRGLAALDLEALGIPSQQEYVSAYVARTGRKDAITPFHLAFALFRLAIILEGVLARAKAGNALDTEAFKVADRALALAERGWALTR